MSIGYRNVMLLLLSGLLLAPPTAAANDAVYRLAQQCYAIQSPGTGKYLDTRSGVLETYYEFRTGSLSGASHFYFKPTELGKFLLTDRRGDFLGSQLASVEVTLDKAGRNTEWQVGASGSRFTFQNRATGAVLKHDYWVTRGWWIFTWKELRTDTAFRLVARSDCRAYPEMSVVAWPDGQPQHQDDAQHMATRLKGNVNQPVRGYIDAHSHVTSDEFMGGKAIHGDTHHRYGVDHALDNCDEDHGPGGRLDIIGGGAKAHDTAGWPDFTDWPAYNSKGHGGYYYKWMERAWLSGLRMVVVYLVENQVLCTVQSTVNPVSWTGGNNSCNTMDSLFLQIRQLEDMVRYVDAQQGGPGKGFLRIVRSPQQARQAAADGKLALLLGVEASEVLNCGERDYCDRNVVETHLNDLYNAGVRVMYPVHKFDNHFGGTSLQGGLVHLGQKLSTGHFFETEDCDAHVADYDGEYVRGRVMESGIPGVPELPVGVVQQLIGSLGPQYPADTEQCNRKGLTDLGAYLVNRMIDKRMIIDLDHLSPKAAATVMDIIDARDYSGVVSTHGWMLKAKDGANDTNKGDDRLHATFRRLAQAGGFSSPLNRDSSRLVPETEGYLLEHMAALYPGLSEMQLKQKLRELPASAVPGIGIGVDMGGLATQANPNGRNPGYPFVNEFGIAFGRQGEAGKRQFDLASDGVAHYGMLADHVALVRKDAVEGGKRYVYDALMNSAEAYLQMWERADQRPLSPHFTP